MNTMHFLAEIVREGAPLLRGRVTAVNADNSIVVAGVGGEKGDIVCDLLHTSDHDRLSLNAGDEVLVWVPSQEETCGVVLGRIGPDCRSAAVQTPVELTLTAREKVTIACGDSSITLRADGKVLIKGKDLVSNAQCANRIKGGSVSIN